MCCSLRVKWPQYFDIHISTPPPKLSYIPQTLSKPSHLKRNRTDKRRVQPRQDRKPTATQHEPLKARKAETLPNKTSKESEQTKVRCYCCSGIRLPLNYRHRRGKCRDGFCLSPQGAPETGVRHLSLCVENY